MSPFPPTCPPRPHVHALNNYRGRSPPPRPPDSGPFPMHARICWSQSLWLVATHAASEHSAVAVTDTALPTALHCMRCALHCKMTDLVFVNVKALELGVPSRVEPLVLHPLPHVYVAQPSFLRQLLASRGLSSARRPSYEDVGPGAGPLRLIVRLHGDDGRPGGKVCGELPNAGFRGALPQNRDVRVTKRA